MSASHTNTRDRAMFGLGLALLLALSWPGVEASAESDLAPSSRALTSLAGAPEPTAPLPVAGESCAASDPALVAKAYDARRAQMEAIAAAMQGQEDGDFVALDGRGYGYFPERNTALELARIQREAAEQARAAALGR